MKYCCKSCTHFKPTANARENWGYMNKCDVNKKKGVHPDQKPCFQYAPKNGKMYFK